MRTLYTFILYLMSPWLILRLWLRGLQVPAYRHNLAERFGYHRPGLPAGVVWIHAVSVGEVRAAEPLIRALQNSEPVRSLLVTTVTPTGRATVQQLFGDNVSCCYLPYDLPGAVRRFLDTVQPLRAVIMETEIWPNLYAGLKQRNIPLYLVNARLSASSLKGYLWFPGLSRTALQCIDHIAAQSRRDADRFIKLGASEEQLSVCGNLKFDTRLPPDFRERSGELKDCLGTDRPVWVAGSTHGGEDDIVLNAHRLVMKRFPQALLVIVPRHPERGREIAALCRRYEMAFQVYKRHEPVNETARVVIVDTLGELLYFYGVASVSCIGGSLVDKGGQNPIEAILAGSPVVSGPSRYNFKGISEELADAGAVIIAENETTLADPVCEWLESETARKAAVEAGMQVIGRNRGVVQQILRVIGASANPATGQQAIEKAR